MENSENLQLITGSEASLKEFNLRNEPIKPLISNKTLIKVNGDHAVPSKLFQTDEDSCESSNSSSSHNLVIDHQEESTPLVLVKDANVTETPVIASSTATSVTTEKKIKEGKCKQAKNKKTLKKKSFAASGIKMTKAIKRKPPYWKENGTSLHKSKKFRLEEHYLSTEIGPSAPSDIPNSENHISRNKLNENNGEENKNSQEELYFENNIADLKETEKQNNLWKRKLQKFYMEKPVPAMLTGRGKESKKGNYSLYQKPNLKYKCFKCFNDDFSCLNELREHQKICLFSDNKKNSIISRNNVENSIQSSTVTSITTRSDCPSIPTSSISNLNSELTMKDSNQQSRKILLSDNSDTGENTKKRIFLCAACGKYFESWNLFIHMRRMHNRHVCLYCFGMFPTAEKLTLHLEMKHDLEQNHFECQERWLRSSRDACYLMCCICEYLFTEQEEFSDHICGELIIPCRYCGLKEQHTEKCKLHLKTRKTKDKLKKNKSMKKSDLLNNSETSEIGTNIGKDQGSNSNSNYREIGTHIQESFCDNILGDNVNSLNPIPSLQQTSIISQVSSNNPHWNTKLNGCVSETGTTKHSQQSHHLLYSQLPSIQRTNPMAGNSIAMTMSKAQYSENIFHCSFEDYQQKTKPNERTSNVTADNLVYLNAIGSNQIDQNNTDPNGGKVNKSEDSILQLSSESNPYSSDPGNKYVEQEKPLTVPKFTIKVPKEYQNKIDSEHSSTETDEEDLDVKASSENIRETHQEIQDIQYLQKEQQEEKEQLFEEFDKEKEKYQENMLFKQEESEKLNNCQKVNDTILTEVKEDDMKTEESMRNQPGSLDINEASNLEQVEMDIEETVEQEKVPSAEEEKRMKPIPEDGIEIADDDVLLIELLLNKPLDKMTVIEFLRICLGKTHSICLYCNHARRIAVNGHSLALHFLSQHRFLATVDSITAEELQPATIILKLKNYLPELETENSYFNMETYCNTKKENVISYERIFECFLCRFETRIHKELYLHNRKMHLKTAILCFMCRANFYSYSEILCHMCPGMANKCVIFDIKFRCCLCDLDEIPSAFRLMVHLRKKHSACDVCLEDCLDQSRLSSHVWKHKLHHLCYRCGIAYRNKPDITKHLFWKHGTESVLCKRCLQKRWPHVYHFCIPPTSFICEMCNLAFSKAMYLKVHKRLHCGDAPYPCTEDNCDKKFISRKLLLKHVAQHNQKLDEPIGITRENNIDDAVPIEDPKSESKEIKETLVDIKENKKIGEIRRNEEFNLKKKKRKLKKEIKENLEDLINLPAPNLSESDSSDESNTAENKLETEQNILNVSKVMLSSPSDIGEDEKDTNPTPMIDIWENFKSFQASKAKPVEDTEEETNSVPTPILHVSQSDHDYCAMYKSFAETNKDFGRNVKAEDMESKKDTDKFIEIYEGNISPHKKKQKTQKVDKFGSDSSSSGSSSSSDSSCSCGSNCSCSSSSGSSSDSSSSSDESDSSTSEGRKRIAAKRAAKQEKRDRSKSESSSPTKAINSIELVDVVTTDTKPLEHSNIEPIILESDLETDESNTDEDFYDDHPQKLASQLLAEKRKQLMIQTCLSPSHNFDIVENSRPSTPSLPEEVLKEKKVKIKKKKRERKGGKSISISPLKLFTPQTLTTSQEILTPRVDNLMLAPVATVTELQANAVNASLPMSPANTSTSIAAPITIKNRLSTGSNSDADAPLKRSKRARRPNKFYGYSSDDDTLTGSNNHLSGPAAFKPTPPPNLTWRKEDLPSPSKSIIHKIRSPANISKKNTPANTPPLPPIPPIIIRPSSNRSGFKSLTTEDVQKPPVVETTTRVPPVPVHHIQPAHQYASSKESVESESSDDDRLQIRLPKSQKSNITLLNYKRKQHKQHELLQEKHCHEGQQYEYQLKQRQQQQQHHQLDLQMQDTNNSSHSNGPSTSCGSKMNPSLLEQKPQQKNIPPALLPNPDFARIQYFKRNNIRYPIRPPAGARPPREGESVYCYCRCPYDEVSEMIACDGDDCVIEWFHFECVGIMVPPKGKWFCAECRPNYLQEMLKDNYENT